MDPAACQGAKVSCRSGCDKHVHSPDALTTKIANKVANNQSAVWAGFGPTGSGKSEGNVVIAMEVQAKLAKMGFLKDPTFNVRRQVAFKPINRKPLAQAAGRFKVILDDESSGEGGHKHQTMSAANVDNAQDLDACRGRQQPIGFATPFMKRLAGPIVDHLMGYLEWHPDHSCEWFEAVRGGPQWDPWVHWESRFTVEKTPWLQLIAPQVGTEYLGAKEDHMKGRRSAAEDILLEDKFYGILSMSPLGRKPGVPQKSPRQSA